MGQKNSNFCLAAEKLPLPRVRLSPGYGGGTGQPECVHLSVTRGEIRSPLVCEQPRSRGILFTPRSWPCAMALPLLTNSTMSAEPPPDSSATPSGSDRDIQSHVSLVPGMTLSSHSVRLNTVPVSACLPEPDWAWFTAAAENQSNPSVPEDGGGLSPRYSPTAPPWLVAVQNDIRAQHDVARLFRLGGDLGYELDVIEQAVYLARHLRERSGAIPSDAFLRVCLGVASHMGTHTPVSRGLCSWVNIAPGERLRYWEVALYLVCRSLTVTDPSWLTPYYRLFDIGYRQRAYRQLHPTWAVITRVLCSSALSFDLPRPAVLLVVLYLLTRRRRLPGQTVMGAWQFYQRVRYLAAAVGCTPRDFLTRLRAYRDAATHP